MAQKKAANFQLLVIIVTNLLAVSLFSIAKKPQWQEKAKLLLAVSPSGMTRMINGMKKQSFYLRLRLRRERLRLTNPPTASLAAEATP